MLDKERVVTSSILQLEAEAAEYGYNVEEPMAKLQELYKSEGGQNLMNLMTYLKL